VAGSLPVVMAVPPPAMARGSGRLVVWFTGGCCAPVTMRARLFRADRVGGGATARPGRTQCGDSAHKQPSAARREFEHRRAFRDKIKWRTGSEGRINHLKRSYSCNRTELTTITGARTWCGHGVFAHNLVKIGALAA
jgi:transposase, IS5 family